MPVVPVRTSRDELTVEATRVEVKPFTEEGSFSPKEQGSAVRERPRVVTREEILLELCHLL